jgi:hypothetical protein
VCDGISQTHPSLIKRCHGRHARGVMVVGGSLGIVVQVFLRWGGTAIPIIGPRGAWGRARRVRISLCQILSGVVVRAGVFAGGVGPVRIHRRSELPAIVEVGLGLG